MCALTRAGRATHCVRLRSDCRKQSLSLEGPRCRDLMFPLFPQFVAVKYRSETYCWTQKRNREDCGSRGLAVDVPDEKSNGISTNATTNLVNRPGCHRVGGGG